MSDLFHGALAPGFLPVPTPLPPRLLAAIAAGWTVPPGAEAVPPPPPGGRSWRRILVAESHDLWLVRWAPGSATRLHDHADSTGALYVAEGQLTEFLPQLTSSTPRTRRIVARRSRGFPVGHVHSVRNDSGYEAVSVHAYSPPLAEMTYYTHDTAMAERYREPVTAASVTPS